MLSLIPTPSMAQRLTAVWLVLMLASLLSFGIGAAPVAMLARPPHLAAAIVLAIAFLKVHLVMSAFMEVRHAPLPLKLLCAAWTIGTGAGVQAFLWKASALAG